MRPTLGNRQSIVTFVISLEVHSDLTSWMTGEFEAQTSRVIWAQITEPVSDNASYFFPGEIAPVPLCGTHKRHQGPHDEVAKKI